MTELEKSRELNDKSKSDASEMMRKESQLREMCKKQHCEIEGLKCMLEKGNSEKYRHIEDGVHRISAMIVNGQGNGIESIRDNPLIQNLIKNGMGKQINIIKEEKKELKSKLEETNSKYKSFLPKYEQCLELLLKELMMMVDVLHIST